MAALRFVGRVASGQDMLDTGIRDLAVAQLPGGPVVYAVTGSGGGIAGYALGAAGPARFADSAAFDGALAGLSAPRLAAMTVDGAPALALTGAAGPVLAWAEIGPDGAIRLPGPGPGPMLAASQGATALAASGAAAAGRLALAEPGAVQLLARDGAGGFAAVARLDDGPDSHLAHVVALAEVRLGDAGFLLAADAAEHGVTSLRVHADGRLETRATIGAAEGLGVNAPTALAVVESGGAQFAVLAAAGSSSLSVLLIGPGGALEATDHVIDTRDTRFAAVQSLAAVEADGRVYLLAGGGDDGLSLFTLLPDGRLVHLESLADAPGLGLAGISAVAAVGLDDTLQILAASESVPGLAQFALPLAAQGVTRRGGAAAETLAGGAGDDLLLAGPGGGRLEARAGEDILVAGPGDDTLEGGPGADIFVLGPGGRDVVADFEPGIDRLDLSAFPLLRDPGQLAIVTTATGARIGFAGTEIAIHSAAGGGLDAADLFPSGRFGGPDRLPLAALEPPPGPADAATPGPDRLQGGPGADRLRGLGGDDRLRGGGGNDVLKGGAGDDTLLGGTGDDRLADGMGSDTLRGLAGNDTLLGGGSADRLTGGGGADRLRGGGGSDTLDGGPGGDRLFGGTGRDRIIGGAGRDTLAGDTGADEFVFRPGAGRDRITDFEPGTDRLELDVGLTGGAATGAEVVADFATVTAAGVRFDFGNGDSLLLAGLDSTAGLEASINVF